MSITTFQVVPDSTSAENMNIADFVITENLLSSCNLANNK